MKKQLLIETRPAQFQIITPLDEAHDPAKPVRVRCEQMSVADQVNGNGRVYPLVTWSREIEKLQEKLQGHRLVGSADHPQDGKSRITGESGTALKWEKIYMDGPVTIGEATILKTQAGKDLQALIEAGVVVDVSSRGFGSALERMVNGKRAQVVQEDFELLTFDAVLGGSVPNAHLQAVVESEQRQGGRASMDWKEVLAGLRKEHPEVFENYEKELQAAQEKTFEQRVLDEVKKQQVTEAELREKVKEEVLEELAPQLEALDAMEAILDNIRSLVSDEEPAVVDAKLKEAAETAIKEKLLAESAVRELKDQLASATARHATERTEADTRHAAEIEAANGKLAVRIAIEEQTAGKPYRLALTERLQQLCSKPEEVASKLADAETYVKRLLGEQQQQSSGVAADAGKGKVADDDAGSKKALTEQQERMKRLAGVL